MNIYHNSITVCGMDVPFYGILGVFGFLTSLLLLLVLCRKCKLSFDIAVYIYITGFLGLLLGAKLLYILVNLPGMIEDAYLLREHSEIWISKYIQSGMVYYGGVIGCFIGMLIARKLFLSLDSYMPALLPCYVLFSLFGRMGCLFTGCCYGKETYERIAVIYHNSMIAPNGVRLIPTQLYEMIFDLTMVVILIFVLLYIKRNELSLFIFLVGYSLYRFIVEFYRGDSERGYISILSISQWISIAIIIITIIVSLKKSYSARKVEKYG